MQEKKRREKQNKKAKLNNDVVVSLTRVDNNTRMGTADPQQQHVLTLIVRQLQHYDLNSLASVVATAAGIDPSYSPSNQLHEWVTAATTDGKDGANQTEAANSQSTAQQPTNTLDIDGPYLSGLTAAEAHHTRAPIPGYATLFVATHKNACRAVAFSRDGIRILALVPV